MTGVTFEQANTMMLGSLEHDVYDLPVWRGNLAGEVTAVISCWEVSEAELAEIIRTRRVWLYVMGQSMPPATIEADDPFTRGEPE